MSAHTPGKWTVDGSTVRTKQGKFSIIICDTAGRDEWQANARLIAAAPELLAALEKCRAELWGILNQVDEQEIKDSFQGVHKALKAAQAAIAKAVLK